MTSQTATSMPMEEERPTASVFMLMNFIPRPFGGALYELKINQAGEVMEGETCGPLEPVQWFFDPKKSSEFPAPVPNYIVLDGVRFGSPSKLYLLPIPDRDMVPNEDRQHLYTFDTETKSLEQIEGPRAFKRSSLLISAYGKLYNLTDPASFPFMTNPLFECYNPKKGIWEPLNPFPKYGEKTGLSYVKVMGYAVCYGCILISLYGFGPSEFVLFHIASETWHPVYIPTVDDDMTGTKPYPSFVGRAVVVNDVIYAASTVSGVIISFSLGMDSDPSGRILFTVKNLFKFPELMSFIERNNAITKSLVHLGGLRFCLLQTFKGWDFQPLRKVAYWYSGSEFPISDINSPLFTHLIYAYTDVNSSSYELSSSSSDSSEQYYSTFTPTVKRKNPSVTTLVSIGGGNADYGVISTMLSSSSHRKSFVDSSIIFARRYGFLGLEFCWASANTSSDMTNMGKLFEEWRAAIASEAAKTSQTPLILTAAVLYRPDFESFAYPVESIRDNLNWVHVVSYAYYEPQRTNFTGAHAALYDPSSDLSTDYGTKSWIGRGLSASKLVLGLPSYGYAWTLSNPRDSAIGAPAKGPAITKVGSMSYKDIKGYIDRYGADIVYNATYVAKYCVIGSAWIGFDDAEVVKIKVSYAKEQKLLGYFIWQVSLDDNWVLSLAAAAQEGGGSGQNKRRFLVIVLTTIASVILLLGSALSYFRMRLHKSKAKESESRENDIADTAGKFNSNVPNLKIFSIADVEAATDGFSIENKLGEGGYGPVYKGVLQDGQEIAVKKLSKASTQGFEEFKNEVMLTAKLQHVNLVRVLGFCIEHHEQMLIYEYMPKKSLDLYLFDPVRRYELDWRKRVQIIKGVTQGLLYLQEYSRLTIIHRDLKASNILLDEEMRPKISDFGMARIFAKDELEANTGRIVGTYGYVPPEYVQKGLYSTKSDVYSFGVLLLQIISGKKNAPYYGSDEDLNLLEYAYLLWKQGKGMEFMDPALDDTHSLCKLMRCLQIALLCVQENAKDRPSMLEISSMLQNEGATMENPKIPAFSKRNEEEETNPMPRLEACSIDDATISEVVAR